MTINITISEKPDVAALVELHAASFQPSWKESDFNGMFMIAHTVAFVAQEGFAVVRLIAGEAEILTFAVNPQARRRGIGGALIASLKEWLKTNKAETVFLEVRQSNLPAINMYVKAEFTSISERKDYYSNPDGSRESAIVMRLAL